MNETRRANQRAAIALGTAFAAAIVAWWMSLAPSPVPASAPPEDFSAERAYQHILKNCNETHPAGSVANDRVCAYIKAELDRLGVENELVQQYVAARDHGIAMHRVVLGRIRGTAPTKAFAMDAHFDSVPYGPGATDDFSGIAAMLETARALKAGSPLKNDILFSFSDEEEFNMGGARAFKDHPWFSDVGVMLGLETRGTSGPALMFETSQDNGFVIREMVQSGANVRANSMMFDVYDRLPFGSDFGQYKKAVAGLNVAYVDDFCDYHTQLDNPQNVCIASLQHHGSYTLKLARHFGNIPLKNCYAPNVTYFNTLGAHTVIYPLSWSFPITLVALGIFSLVFIAGLWTRRLRWRETAFAVLGIIASMLLSALLIGLISLAIFFRFRETALYQNNLYCLSFALLALAIFFSMAGRLRERVRPQEFLAAALLCWVLPLCFIQIWLSGGSYIAAWPMITLSVSLAIMISLSRQDQPSIRALGLLTLPALIPVVLIVPMLVMFSYTITVMGSFLLAVILILLVSFLSPQIYLLNGSMRWRIAGAMAGLAVIGLMTAYVGCLPSPSTPRLNCLSYGVDFDKGQAYWLSADRYLDEWTSKYFPNNTERQSAEEFLPGDHNRYLKAPAPMPPFSKLVMEVKEDRIQDGRRILNLRLDSPRDAQRITIETVSEVNILSAQILGNTLRGRDKHWRMEFAILPREGADMLLEVEPNQPLVFKIIEKSFGLPAIPGLEPRPPYMATEPNRTLDHKRPLRSEHTFSVCTIDLGSQCAPKP